jgi:D-alanyl-D-alanine carboxypeptidase (penicillin-binding protein 5/6)
MNPAKRDNNFLILVLILAALGAFLFLFNNYKLEQKEKKLEAEKHAQIEKINTAFGALSLEAKALSVYDATENKKIYGQNDQDILPIASLAKIMTVLVALDEHSPGDEIKILQSSVAKNGDSGLRPNEKWQIGNLAKFTLVLSANDGADALSGNNAEFLNKMNHKTEEIGLENTIFFNNTGLDIDAGFAGAYATAEDVNTMAVFALKAYPEIFSATVLPEIEFKSESGFSHQIKNTDTILEKIPNILFSKTGMTTLAGGNLTVIFKDKNNHEIAITVLGSTPEGRFSDMEKLVEVAYNLSDGSSN